MYFKIEYMAYVEQIIAVQDFILISDLTATFVFLDADGSEVWSSMLRMDNSDLFLQKSHPSIQLGPLPYCNFM